MSNLEILLQRKREWRRSLLEQRRAALEMTHSAEAGALREAMSHWVAEQRVSTICAYVPVRGEPGSLDMLDALRDAGCRVLLPIVVGAAPLDWAEYTGPDSLRPAQYGLREPTGDRLGERAIASADAVLVPALAVDRAGVRLGRGGGHYDRSLPLAASSARLVAVVGDAEFVAELPGEEHDVRMNAVLTPKAGVAPLPALPPV